jgi:hypothetical protein
LANLVALEDYPFAEFVCSASSSGGQAPFQFTNLRELANWLQHMGSHFPDRGVAPYGVLKCLPLDLSNLSRCNPKYQQNWKAEARARLDWLLSQEDGDYVAVVIASDNQSNHVVGVSISRAVIFDHEIRSSLPCSAEGFDSTCGGQTTCIGLGEVRKVVRNTSRKRSRPGAMRSDK